MKIGIIIQARMGSTRLPGKIFLPVSGKTMLEIEIERLRGTGFPLYIATTIQPNDQKILEFGKINNIPTYAGDEHNVLNRYYECAKKFKLDVIVRVTADCPLIDPFLIKNAIHQYLDYRDKTLFLSNTLERTYPRGFDFEIFAFELLEDAYRNAVEPADLEHVTPYIWKNKSGKVKFKQIKLENSNYNHFRITLDTADDYKMISILINNYQAASLTGNEIIDILSAHPEIAAINSSIKQKDV